MGTMFNACVILSNLDVSSFDTGEVTNMNSMFQGCTDLTDLNLNGFNTSKVTSMDGMFQKCYRLQTLYFTTFNTSNVVNMNRMFAQCYNLTTTIIIRTEDTTYVEMFVDTATNSPAKIVVNYTNHSSTLVDQMLTTKSTNFNVVKGTLIAN